MKKLFSRKKEVAPKAADPAEETLFAEEKKKFTEKINQLQKRQMELVKQTAEELALLEKEIHKSRDITDRITKEKEPLLVEITQLKGSIQILAKEKEAQQQHIEELYAAFRGYYHQMQSIIKEELPALAVAPVAPVAQSVHVEKTTLAKAEVKKEALAKPKKKRSVKRFVRRSLAFALLVAGCYFGWNKLKNTMLAAPVDTSAGQVAGVSTDQSVVSDKTTDQSYPESFADVPYAQTVWDTIKDPDMQVTLQYPKNTSNLVRVVGGSNLWFLRKNGYLFKITRVDTKQTLDQWMNDNKADYKDDYSLGKTTLKGLPAWQALPTTHTITTGIQYFVKKGDVLYQIWMKDEPATTDDGQRMNKMLDSLTFTSTTPN